MVLYLRQGTYAMSRPLKEAGAAKAAQQKKQEIVAAVAQHLLQHGFRNSGLRALAKSAGLSDRMVMYYFETKEDLVTQALLLLADGLSHSLSEILPNPRASGAQIINTMRTAGATPEVKPLLRLWFEIVGLAMHEEGPYRGAAQLILEDWENWIKAKLGPKREHLAPDVLAQIEGHLLVLLLRGD